MAQETLVNNTATVIGRDTKDHSGAKTIIGSKTEAKKPAAVSAAGKGGNKHKKLYVHLWIGFIMTTLVVAGYAFFGPTANAQAAEPVGNHFINVSNNVPASSSAVQTVVSNTQVYDPAALQAEMDLIMQRMDTLITENMSMSPTTPMAGSAINGNAPRYGSSISPTSLNQMINRTNSIDITQPGGTTSSTSGGGHGH